MNKHKATWSSMHDSMVDQSQLSKDYEKFRKEVELFANKYDINEAVSIIRKVYEKRKIDGEYRGTRDCSK